jgi:hypothetical protein
MESFDQSLKYLLQHEPADFISFGLGDPTVEILEPLPSVLPSRGRDVDGSYVILHGGERQVAHLEFHRRHQSLDELAVDVAEAQIRLYRRDCLPVLSLVWDLYGHRDEPVLEERTLRYGASSKRSGAQIASPGESLPGQPNPQSAGAPTGSLSIYQRVNLRGLGWKELLRAGPPALWPLVALAREGASEEAVHAARDAIEGREELSATEKADYLAVLWFVAEAEEVPVRVMKAYITEERLMASTLYQEIFAKGEAKGEARAETKLRAETIIRILTRRMGALDPAIRERIRTLSDTETLADWYDEAFSVIDAEGAQQLAEKIRKAPLP